MALSTYRLKSFINEKKFNEQHRLYSENEDSIEIFHESPVKKRLCEHVKIMSHNIQENYLTDFFHQENLKLEMRKKNFININGGQEVPNDNKYDLDSPIHSMETYGNALFDFCFFRLKLKDFTGVRLKNRQTCNLLRIVYDVSKAISKDTSLPTVQYPPASVNT